MGHEVEEFFYGSAVGEFYGKSRREERSARNAELVEVARRDHTWQRQFRSLFDRLRISNA